MFANRTFAQRDRCCLCGKKKDQVGKLIVGLHGAVCSDCIDLCEDILGNAVSTAQTSGPAGELEHLQTLKWDGVVTLDPDVAQVFGSPNIVMAVLGPIAAVLRHRSGR